jgi:hypothetical protein
MAVTIIAENYEEYTWIKPVGYTLCGLLSYQMLNNGVHWASDYPLGFAIGYMMGKSITKNSRKKVAGTEIVEKVTYDFVPAISNEGRMGLGLNISY